MTNFAQRIITGAVFLAVMISAIVFGPVTLQFLFLVICLLSLHEFLKLVTTDATQPVIFPSLVSGAVIYIVSSGTFSAPSVTPPAYIILVSAMIFFIELFRKKRYPFHNIFYSLGGIIYTVLPFAILIRMSYITGDYNYRVPLGFFIILWTFDSFAYVFGRWLGRNKLFERISPKKTWEGFGGGLIMALIAAILLYKAFGVLSIYNWLIVAIIISVSGTLADLVESMLKRSLNKKDSGSLLPGHGGLLDRFDAMLLAAPVVYATLLLSHWITRM